MRRAIFVFTHCLKGITFRGRCPRLKLLGPVGAYRITILLEHNSALKGLKNASDGYRPSDAMGFRKHLVSPMSRGRKGPRLSFLCPFRAYRITGSPTGSCSTSIGPFRPMYATEGTIFPYLNEIGTYRILS